MGNDLLYEKLRRKMKRFYKTTQINKALKLVKSGLTRKEAAAAANINVHAIGYYLSKTKAPKIKKSLLKHHDVHTLELKVNRAIKTLQSLL